MLDNIKLMLGDASSNYTDELINLYYSMAESEVKTYCNRTALDTELELIAQRIAIIKLNRQNTEGLNSQSMSGISENYLDGYPADIVAILNRKRKIKVMY